MVFDYIAQEADELSIKVEEILEVLSVEVQQEGLMVEGFVMIVHICVCIHVFMYIWPNYIENDNRMEVATVSLYLVFVKIFFFFFQSGLER